MQSARQEQGQARDSTQPLSYDSGASGASVIKSLPDGVLERGVGPGDIGPLAGNAVEVQPAVLAWNHESAGQPA
jgi:hypothetical protein